MDKIITVYGDGNTGKTTVINEIYDFLIKNGATVVHKKSKLAEIKMTLLLYFLIREKILLFCLWAITEL